MRGPVVAVVALAAALAPGWAAAAPNPVTTERVQGGVAAVSACGTLSGVSVSWSSRSGVVMDVVLGALPSTCTGGTLSVTFAAADNSSLGTAGPAVLTGTSISLGVSGSPTASAVSRLQVSVVGP